MRVNRRRSCDRHASRKPANEEDDENDDDEEEAAKCESVGEEAAGAESSLLSLVLFLVDVLDFRAFLGVFCSSAPSSFSFEPKWESPMRLLRLAFGLLGLALALTLAWDCTWFTANERAGRLGKSYEKKDDGEEDEEHEDKEENKGKREEDDDEDEEHEDKEDDEENTGNGEEGEDEGEGNV